jgi:hypothetical protein
MDTASQVCHPPMLYVCADISLTPVHWCLHTNPPGPPLFQTQYTEWLLDTHLHQGHPCDSLTTPACCGQLLHPTQDLSAAVWTVYPPCPC